MTGGVVSTISGSTKQSNPMPLALVTQLPVAGPLCPVYTICVAPVALPERLSWSTPLATEPLVMETAEPITLKSAIAPALKVMVSVLLRRGMRITFLFAPVKHCVVWIRWIGVRKTWSVIQIALQHPGDVEANALVTIGEIEMAAFMSVQASGGHHTEPGKLIGKQTLTVPQIDIESGYVVRTWTRGFVSRTWKT